MEQAVLVFYGFFGNLELAGTLWKGNWLGCQDSNLGMAESKSAALPLGYTPAVLEVTGLYGCFEWGSRVNTSLFRPRAAFRRHTGPSGPDQPGALPIESTLWELVTIGSEPNSMDVLRY